MVICQRADHEFCSTIRYASKTHDPKIKDDIFAKAITKVAMLPFRFDYMSMVCALFEYELLRFIVFGWFFLCFLLFLFSPFIVSNWSQTESNLITRFIEYGSMNKEFESKAFSSYIWIVFKILAIEKNGWYFYQSCRFSHITPTPFLRILPLHIAKKYAKRDVFAQASA